MYTCMFVVVWKGMSGRKQLGKAANAPYQPNLFSFRYGHLCHRFLSGVLYIYIYIYIYMCVCVYSKIRCSAQIQIAWKIKLTNHVCAILVNKANSVHNLFLVYLSISTCFGRICAHHQEKQLCLCDTWYLLFCLVCGSICYCMPDSNPHRITSTKCRISRVVYLDDMHRFAQNIWRLINILRINCASIWLYLQESRGKQVKKTQNVCTNFIRRF